MGQDWKDKVKKWPRPHITLWSSPSWVGPVWNEKYAGGCLWGGPQTALSPHWNSSGPNSSPPRLPAHTCPTHAYRGGVHAGAAWEGWEEQGVGVCPRFWASLHRSSFTYSSSTFTHFTSTGPKSDNTLKVMHVAGSRFIAVANLYKYMTFC